MKTICYLSYGYPSIKHSLKMAEIYCEAGGDMIEVSLPAKTPWLDTEFIAERMRDALEACGDYEQYLSELSAFCKRNPNTPIVLLLYEHTIVEIGVEKMLQWCDENGVHDMIYAGMKDESVKRRLIEAGMRISCPVTHQMLDEDVDAAIHSNGFVYMEARPQKPAKPGFETLDRCIGYLRAQGITRPIYCGVGVRTPEDARYAKASGGDGVFIGSALIRLYDEPEKLRQTIAEFKAAIED